jgi:hypothetical protein
MTSGVEAEASGLTTVIAAPMPPFCATAGGVIIAAVGWVIEPIDRRPTTDNLGFT